MPASLPPDVFKKRSVSGQELSDYGMKSFVFREPSLLHFDSSAFPKITAAVTTEHQWYPVQILTKAKQSIPRATWFNIAFIAFQDDTHLKPFFAKVKKTVNGKSECIEMPPGLKAINE